MSAVVEYRWYQVIRTITDVMIRSAEKSFTEAIAGAVKPRWIVETQMQLGVNRAAGIYVRNAEPVNTPAIYIENDEEEQI